MKPFTHSFRLLCCVLIFPLAAFTAQAQITYVTPNGAGDNSGSSWTNAAPGTQLQSKINGAANGSQVWVAAGTYKPTTGTDRNIYFSLKNGVGVYGGFNGGESSLAQRNYFLNATILSGDIGTPGNNNDNSFLIIRNSYLGNTAVLDGITVRDANAGDNYPGAVSLYNSSPSILNCKFLFNWGTALDILGGSPSIVNCLF